MKAFIGHSFDAKDSELVRDFKELIESAGIECISGEKAQNTSIAQKIKNRIAECDLFVGIFTCDKPIASSPTEFTTSSWVHQEAGFAIGQKKALLFIVEKGVRKFPELQGDLELIYFERNTLNKAYIKLNQMLQAIKAGENSTTKEASILDQPNQDRLAELELKVRNYISKRGYELLPNNRGFDILAKKEILMSSNEYLAVGFNLNARVSPSFVRDFLDMISKFNRKQREDNSYIIWAPILQGLIAYTGELTENVANLTEGFKPIVHFKQF